MGYKLSNSHIGNNQQIGFNLWILYVKLRPYEAK